MNQQLQAAQRDIETLRGELTKYFSDHKGADGQYNMTSSQVEEVNRRNDELSEKCKAFEALQKAYKAEEENRKALEQSRTPVTSLPMPGSDVKQRDHRSIGDRFAAQIKGKSLGQMMNSSFEMSDVDLKTLFQRTAGWDPEEVRNRPVVLSAQRPVQVTDLMPSRPINQAAIKYMEETTFTNNAAEVAEAATYGEAALVLAERSQIVEKIGVWLPVTDEQLEDEEGIRGYIDNRLTFMLKQRLDSQLMNGNGTTPNLLGVLNKAGIQTQAKGGDPTPDAVYKAMTLIRVTGRAMPSAFVVHPTDWQEIKLLRTADGIYIWGSPADVGPDRIWGLQVVQADSLTVGTAVVGDFANFCELAYKRGIEVQVTNAHSDFFINGKQAIRADVRCVAVWYRAAAFCTVTGI